MLKTIYTYINYRTYLKDFYESKKAENEKFSYRLFSRLCGFSSPNFLKLVMLGQRNLSHESADRIAKALKLKVKEGKFFQILVQFNQAETREEKAECYKRLLRFKSFRDIKFLEAGSYEFFSKWYHVVIFEMVELRCFKEDPVWIAKRLRDLVTEKEVQESIQLLLGLGLLKHDSKRRLKQVDKNLSTDQEVMDLSVANFHDNMIALAAESIDRSDDSIRDISSVTVAIDHATFLEAKKRIQNFRRELNVLLSECKQPDSVYQINFQIFNLTEVPWKKS